MKNNYKEILKSIPDDIWQYAFTITTNIRFSDHTSYDQNNDIIKQWMLKKVIKVLSSIIKDIVKNNPKYKDIKLKDLMVLKKLILENIHNMHQMLKHKLN